MFRKRVLESILGMFLIFFLACPMLARMPDVCNFKGVEISCKLLFKHTILEKGKYDLEVLKNPNGPQYFLRIKKGNKILCLIDGERVYSEALDRDRRIDPSYPRNPRLKMKKDPEEKVFYFTVETGKLSRFPYLLLIFKMAYED
jgi:hypothetical protein